MRRRSFQAIGLVAAITASAFIGIPALAQEGHPLTGTWSGDWGPNATQRTHITLVMSFDGDKVTGIMNPGPEAVNIQNISLDVTNWTVRIQADMPVQIAADGKIEDLSSPHRTLSGTWNQGKTKGDFKLTRD